MLVFNSMTIKILIQRSLIDPLLVTRHAGVDTAQETAGFLYFFPGDVFNPVFVLYDLELHARLEAHCLANMLRDDNLVFGGNGDSGHISSIDNICVLRYYDR